MFNFKWNIQGLSEEEAWDCFLKINAQEKLSLEGRVHIQEEWRAWCAAQKKWSWGFFMAALILCIALAGAFVDQSNGVYAWVALLWINAMLWSEHQEVKMMQRQKAQAQLMWLDPEVREDLEKLEDGPQKALHIFMAYEIKREKEGWERKKIEVDPLWSEFFPQNLQKK